MKDSIGKCATRIARMIDRLTLEIEKEKPTESNSPEEVLSYYRKLREVEDTLSSVLFCGKEKK